MTACSLAAMSMPVIVSSMTSDVAVPVLLSDQLPPETTLALTNCMSALEADRSSRIRTSYSGMPTGEAGTLMVYWNCSPIVALCCVFAWGFSLDNGPGV